jgi:dTDP-4-amino-4,6-dideoxygalactose transaminase
MAPSAQDLALFGGSPAVTEKTPVWPQIDAEAEAAVVEFLRSGQPLSAILPNRNPLLEQFQRTFADRHERRHGLATNAGTAALTLAVCACGVGPGDEVITSPYTWGATVGCILEAGGTPVFCDIDPQTFNMDPARLPELLTPRTKAIMVVHIFGHPCDMDPILEFARKHDLKVIEDCAQAHEATYKGKRVGMWSDAACFSFQGSKHLVCGEGGILLTDDDTIYQRALVEGLHPARHENEVTDPEIKRYSDCLCANTRPNPLGFALASAQLPHLAAWVANRQQNAARLAAGIADLPGIHAPYVAPDCTHAYHFISLTYKADEVGGLSRDRFVEAMRAEGLGLMRYVGTPIHLRARFQNPEGYFRRTPGLLNDQGRRRREYNKGDCPVAEQRCAEEELMFMTAHVPVPTLIDQQVEAFRKVVGAADALRQDAPAEAQKTS